jgi:hypothetical protein
LDYTTYGYNYKAYCYDYNTYGYGVVDCDFDIEIDLILVFTVFINASNYVKIVSYVKISHLSLSPLSHSPYFLT